MHAARWWYERLRAMSLAEVVHRSARLARYPLDVAQQRAGLYARPPRALLARWRGPAVFVFDDARAPLSPELEAEAEGLLAGRQVVLGLGAIELPDEPWHYEPGARRWWPRVDAGRVIAAAPAELDPRTTWELNRGHGWVVLARAWAATRDARYLDRLIAELRSWQRGNPIGVGINWVSAMEAAIRCHAFAWIAALLRGADRFPWPLLAGLLYQHAGFVARNLSRFSSANNHLIVELSGLIVAGRVLDVPRWRDLAPLAREAERQTFADGVNVEMATHYHVFVLEALLLVAWLERAHGEPAHGVERVIARMARYLDAISLASGDVLDHGDHDDGALIPLFAPRHAAQLRSAAAALAGGPADVDVDVEAGDGARLLCNGAPTLPAPSPRSRLFADAGQVVLCGPRLRASFDAGPFGFGALTAHAHCDALALNVAFDDRPLLVERGTYRYHGDRAARDAYRSTAAHNTVQLGAREQGDLAGPFLWTRKPTATIERCALSDALDLVRAHHDGFAPARHTRTVLRVGDALAVIDELDDTHQAIARWHLAPGVELLELNDRGAVIRDPGAAPGTDRWLWFGCDHHPLRARAITTPHSARYLAQQLATTLEIDIPGPELDLIRRPLLTIIGADVRDRGAVLRAMHDVIHDVIPDAMRSAT